MTRMLAPGLAALGMAAIVALIVPQAASAAEPGTSAGGDARITAASRCRVCFSITCSSGVSAAAGSHTGAGRRCRSFSARL